MTLAVLTPQRTIPYHTILSTFCLIQADEIFRKEAEEATRSNPEWSYTRELASLKSSLIEVANRSKKIAEVKLQASKQNQQAMQYLQMQQQQLQAIQQQISVSVIVMYIVTT